MYWNCTSYPPQRSAPVSKGHYSHSLLYKYRNTITLHRAKSEAERPFSYACFSSAMRLPPMKYCFLNHFPLLLFQSRLASVVHKFWMTNVLFFLLNISFLAYFPSLEHGYWLRQLIQIVSESTSDGFTVYRMAWSCVRISKNTFRPLPFMNMITRRY